jgi:hypothetical protein
MVLEGKYHQVSKKATISGGKKKKNKYLTS